MRRAITWTSLGAAALFLACAGDVGPEEETPESRVEVLHRGATFRGANGVHFGPDGKLYVASVVTPVIAALDPDSGEIVRRIGPDEGADSPDDLAFGPDGSLYWTDINHGEVGRLRPDGTAETVANLGPGVNPITFSDDGRLFVSQCFFGTGLYEVDPDGEEEPRVIRSDLGPGCGLNGMDWGPDGKLYGPRWFRGEVARVDVDSGELETVASGFEVPAAVKFDPEGRLHVLDSKAGEVVRVDLESGEKTVVANVGEGGLDNLAFSDDGRLFVSSFGDGWVAEAMPDGTLRTLQSGGLAMPGGVAVATFEGEPTVFVADLLTFRGLDAESGEETMVERDYLGVSALGSMMTVHATDDGRLVISSWLDNGVKVFDPATRTVEAVLGDFGRPLDALAFGDDLVISELDSGSVLRVRTDEPEERAAVATGLQVPAGLAASDDGTLYVADRGTGSVLVLARDDAYLEEPEVLLTGLARPEGIAVAGESLLVVETGARRLSLIDLATRTSTPIGEDLAVHVESQGDFPPTMLFNGVATDGTFAYVTGDLENVLYRIRL